jgi:hypothetical protein
MLTPRIGVPAALAVSAPGIFCTLLVALVPHSAYGLIAFVMLAPIATLTLALRLFSA